jgi:hypothetical protein
MQIRKCALWAITCFHSRVCFFSSAVLQAFVDPILHWARMIAVSFDLDHLLSPVRPLAFGVCNRWSALSRRSMSALTARLAVQRATSTASALADVQRDLVPEPHRLEIAFGIVQALPAIICAGLVGDVIALTLADLRNSGRATAHWAFAGSDASLNVLVGSDAAAWTMTSVSHLLVSSSIWGWSVLKVVFDHANTLLDRSLIEPILKAGPFGLRFYPRPKIS